MGIFLIQDFNFNSPNHYGIIPNDFFVVCDEMYPTFVITFNVVGGCLGEGYLLQSGNSSTLFIAGKTFLGNQTYIFHLAVSKPGRTHVGWAKQTVLLMPGNPPALVIK